MKTFRACRSVMSGVLSMNCITCVRTFHPVGLLLWLREYVKATLREILVVNRVCSIFFLISIYNEGPDYINEVIIPPINNLILCRNSSYLS
jgi:hypothetical protein